GDYPRAVAVAASGGVAPMLASAATITAERNLDRLYAPLLAKERPSWPGDSPRPTNSAPGDSPGPAGGVRAYRSALENPSRGRKVASQPQRNPTGVGAGASGLAGSPVGVAGRLNGAGATSLGASGRNSEARYWICPRPTPSSNWPPPLVPIAWDAQ